MDNTNPKDTGEEDLTRDDNANLPSHVTADAIMLSELSGKEDPDSPGIVEREKATELQFLWTVAALVLLLLIVISVMLITWCWFGLEQNLQDQLLQSVEGSSVVKEQVEIYEKLSEKTFDRTWKIVDRVVLGGLMSLLTLIIGYVFGTRNEKLGS